MLNILLLVALPAACLLIFQALRSYRSKMMQSIWDRWPKSTPSSTTLSRLDEKISLQEIQPYQLPPLKVKSSTRMAMGLKRLDESNWLTIDTKYLSEHAIRQQLLATIRPNVIECLPPSKIACHEVLDAAVSFLLFRFPSQFSKSKTANGPVITNHLTGETYPIGSQCQNPLEVAALLAMEDFNVLMKNTDTGDYLLQASATLFPAGWKLQERIGTSMANLHHPVPGWNEKLGSHVNRYFDHLSPKTAMERSTVFIQTTDEYFQDKPEPVPEGGPTCISASDVRIRRERQTFTRLPMSNAVLFTVRTYMTPLIELGDEELLALRSLIWSWEEDIRQYKGWALWGDAVEGWCEKKLGKRDESEKIPKGGCPLGV